MKIELPWPPVKQLSPNSRVHWSKKAAAAKDYRTLCFWETKVSGAKITWKGPIVFSVTFYPPDRRDRDDDNIISAFKSGRDGIASALMVDDKRFKLHPVLSDQVVKGGKVVVEITQGEKS